MHPKSLPFMALKEIPEPKENAKTIIALVKHRGRVIGYQLSNKEIVDKEEAIALARAGAISGIAIGSRKGTEYLKSLPDGQEKDNLSNLPTITKAM
jgi:hypothetical protein